MLTNLQSNLEVDYPTYVNQTLCDLCSSDSKANCTGLVSISSSFPVIASQQYINIDEISHIIAYPNVKICDGIIIDIPNKEILFVEITIPAKPLDKSCEEYKKEFIDKIRGTRFILKYLAYRKYNLRFHGNNIRLKFKPVFSKVPPSLAPKQAQLNIAEMLMLKSISVKNITVLDMYIC